MDVNLIREMIEPFVQIFSALIVSGASVAIATQILKLDWFPVAVEKYPRITSAVLSVISAVITVYVSGINFVFTSLFDYIGFTVGTALLSAFTYKTILKGTVPTKDGTATRL